MLKLGQWKECTAEFAKQNPDKSRVRERVDEGHQWSWSEWYKVSDCELQDDGWYEFQTLETQN